MFEMLFMKSKQNFVSEKYQSFNFGIEQSKQENKAAYKRDKESTFTSTDRNNSTASTSRYVHVPFYFYIDIYSEIIDELRDLEKTETDFFEKALTLGVVKIVTNANADWFRTSCLTICRGTESNASHLETYRRS